MKLTISGQLPSLNALFRMHWAVKKKINDTYIWWIKYQVDFLPEKIKERKSVKIIVYQKTRRMDEDNLPGALTGIINALRKTNLIYNDSPRWLDLKISQAIDHDNPRVEIEIEEA